MTTSDLTALVLKAIEPEIETAIKNLVHNLQAELKKSGTQLSEEKLLAMMAGSKGASKTTSKSTTKESSSTSKPPAEKTAPAKKGKDVKITIVTGYGKKSDALFGDTMAIKDDLNKFNADLVAAKKSKLVGYNGRLSFGAGWTVMDPTRLGEVKALLKKLGVTVREVTRKAYEEEHKGSKASKETPKEDEGSDAGSDTESDSDSDAESSKSTDSKGSKGKKGKEAPAEKPKTTKGSKGATTKPEPKENKYGNMVDEDTGFVFAPLPLGAGGRVVSYVVGRQDEGADLKKVKGLDSVLPLGEDELEICKEKGWQVVNEATLQQLKKKDAKIAAKLEAILARAVEEDSDEDSDDESDSDEDGSDDEGEKAKEGGDEDGDDSDDEGEDSEDDASDDDEEDDSEDDASDGDDDDTVEDPAPAKGGKGGKGKEVPAPKEKAPATKAAGKKK